MKSPNLFGMAVYSVLSVCLYCHVLSASDFWSQAKGPGGGEISCINLTANGVVFSGTNGGGVYRSFDHGLSWTHVGLSYEQVNAMTSTLGFVFAGTYNQSINRMRENDTTWTICDSGMTGYPVSALGVTNNGAILAGTTNGFGASAGIFRSTDKGDSWMRVYREPLNRTVICFAFTSAGHIFSAVYAAGLIHSTDDGETWMPVTPGLANTTVRSMAVNNTGSIFAASSNQAGAALYRSTDDGQTWPLVYSEQPAGEFLAVETNQAGHVFVGKDYGGVSRSADDGASWTNINAGLPYFTDVRAIATGTTGSILIGTYGDGIYGSTDNGAAWVRASSGLNHTRVNAFALTGEGHIYAATGGIVGGVYRSTDDGFNWTQVYVGLTKVFAVCRKDNGYIFAGTDGDGIYRSTNNGASWNPSGLQNLTIRSLVVNNNGDILAGGFDGQVYRSINNGANWTETNYPPPNGAVYQLLHVGSGLLFAATSRGVLRSQDDGLTWERVGFPTSFVFGIAANANGYLVAGTDESVYGSTDNGQSWTVIDSSLIGGNINAVAVSNSGNVFAGVGTNFEGMYQHTKESAGWVEINSGLTNTVVLSLAVTPDGYLLVGTGGGGVFRSSHKVTSVHSPIGTFPTAYVLSQNYPNPFNPATTIEFSIPIAGKVTLAVFDVLGREVSTLLNETMQPGSYSVPFDASASSSGVYFCRIISNGYVKTIKMVLAK